MKKNRTHAIAGLRTCISFATCIFLGDKVLTNIKGIVITNAGRNKRPIRNSFSDCKRKTSNPNRQAYIVLTA